MTRIAYNTCFMLVHTSISVLTRLKSLPITNRISELWKDFFDMSDRNNSIATYCQTALNAVITPPAIQLKASPT